MDNILIIIGILFVFFTFLACRFLLRDYGFKSLPLLIYNEKDCNHLEGTFLEPEDTCDTAIKKAKSVLNIHKKTGMWKTCYITSLIILLLLIVCYNSTKNNKNNYYFYILSFIIIFTVIYTVYNFEIFHKYYPNNRNGKKIIDFISENCMKNTN